MLVFRLQRGAEAVCEAVSVAPPVQLVLGMGGVGVLHSLKYCEQGRGVVTSGSGSGGASVGSGPQKAAARDVSAGRQGQGRRRGRQLTV